MPGDFLGSGWSFPIGLDENGRIKMASDETSISQAIWTILGTAWGERVMHPDFGCGINDMVFAVNNAETAGRLSSVVKTALLQWEPRIDVLDVQVSTGENGSSLDISISYQVRSNNNIYNLVYPFYLERNTA
jgi:uncharacterized protein